MLLIDSICSGRTKKYIFKLSDGYIVESAAIMFSDRMSICLSTQVGCAISCTFCNSGKKGLVRNLKTNEIEGQIDFLINDNELVIGRNVELSFMGMGEPLHNFDNVIESVKNVRDKLKVIVSLSTVGISDRIDDLDLHSVDNLQISLHHWDDSIRRKLIQYPNLENIEKIMGSASRYTKRSNRRVYVNYILLKGINDSYQDSAQLAHLIKKYFPLNRRPYIRVSKYNNTINEGGINDFEPSLRHESFLRHCKSNRLLVYSFISEGVDKYSGCGQFAVSRYQETDS